MLDIFSLLTLNIEMYVLFSFIFCIYRNLDCFDLTLHTSSSFCLVCTEKYERRTRKCMYYSHSSWGFFFWRQTFFFYDFWKTNIIIVYPNSKIQVHVMDKLLKIYCLFFFLDWFWFSFLGSCPILIVFQKMSTAY